MGEITRGRTGVYQRRLSGSKQVPQIARQLGRGLREVKETVADVDPREDVKRAMDTSRPVDAPDDESSAER